MVRTQARSKGVDLEEIPRTLMYPLTETRVQELADCSFNSRVLVEGQPQTFSQLIEEVLVNNLSTSLFESEMALESNQSMKRSKSVSI